MIAPADVAGEPAVHAEYLERSALTCDVVQLFEQRQGGLQLAHALGHLREIQQHHPELRLGIRERATFSGRRQETDRLPREVEAAGVVAVAAPEGAQRGEDAPLADRVAVGQRQRRLEIGARGLEVAEDGVHLGPGLQHLAPFDEWYARPDRGVQRLVVARQGLCVCPCPARQRRRPARVRGGLAPRFGLEIVVSEPGGEVGEPIRVERRQRVGRPADAGRAGAASPAWCGRRPG